MATYYGCSVENGTKMLLDHYLSLLVSDWKAAMAAENYA
jgi:hypothetical protein